MPDPPAPGVRKVQQLRLATQLLLSQVAILLLSFILAYYPGFYLAAILAYIAVLVGGQYIAQRRSGARETSRVLSSRTLYSERNIQEVMMSDEELAEEYARIVKTLFLPTMATIPLAIILFMLLPGLYDHLLSLAGAPETLHNFLKWLLVFETISLLSISVRLAAQRKHGQPQVLSIPTSYEVREEGLVLNTGLRPLVIPFPLDAERYELRIDENRRFVELVDRKSGARIRLYSTRPRRVYELIRRLGFGKTPQSGS